MEKNNDVCKLCGEKLEKKEGDALYYCMKCNEQTNKEKTLRRRYKWQRKPKEQQKELQKRKQDMPAMTAAQKS